MVNEIRVPSSSSSSSSIGVSLPIVQADVHGESIRTNGDGLDLDTILDMGIARVIGILVLQDALAAQGIDKRRPAYSVM